MRSRIHSILRVSTACWCVESNRTTHLFQERKTLMGTAIEQHDRPCPVIALAADQTFYRSDPRVSMYIQTIYERSELSRAICSRCLV